MQQVKTAIKGQRGYVLPLVLALLALGGLTITSSLSYAATTLNSSRIISEKTNGIYAADTGMENTLWALKNGVPPSSQLPEAINHMQVAIQTEAKGAYTLYFGELIQPGEHSDYLTVSGDIVWEESAAAYRYTITVTKQPLADATVIHLEEIGARLPPGYSYQAGSAAGFADNLSTIEPDVTLDGIGAYMLNWDFVTPLPSVSDSDPVKTQTFYIAGEGEQQGNYAWVVANRTDIGQVGEISGSLYEITATATRPEDGQATARIRVDAFVSPETIYIYSWRIDK